MIARLGHKTCNVIDGQGRFAGERCEVGSHLVEPIDRHLEKNRGLGRPKSVIARFVATPATHRHDLHRVGVRVVSHHAEGLGPLDAMPRHIEDRDGVWWVANPVLDDENFADKWRTHPERRRHFLAWMRQLHADLHGTADERGIDKIVARFVDGFGIEARKAAESFGFAAREAQRSGILTSAASTGALTTGTGVHVRDHTFYGRR